MHCRKGGGLPALMPIRSRMRPEGLELEEACFRVKKILVNLEHK